MRPSHERMVQAIEQTRHHYANAAAALGLTTSQFRKWMAYYKERGLKFPKSTARGGVRNDVYEPTPEEIAATCRAIREAKGEILPPTQAEWDNAIGDGA